MINLILLLIAIVLSILFYPIGLVYAILTRGLKSLSKDSWDSTISIDKLGNVWCKHLFNDLLIHANGYRFGNPTDTISRVLGINKRDNTLYPLGRAVAFILNAIDKSHVEKAANKL